MNDYTFALANLTILIAALRHCTSFNQAPSDWLVNKLKNTNTSIPTAAEVISNEIIVDTVTVHNLPLQVPLDQQKKEVSSSAYSSTSMK